MNSNEEQYSWPLDGPGQSEDKRSSWVEIAALAIGSFIIGRIIFGHMQARKDVTRKFKYFRPIIKEGFWGRSITWVARDKPLTDQEISEFVN